VDHPDDYDFGVDYFYIIAEEILARGTEEEAALLACLFTRIMQAEEIEYALGLLVAHQLENPGNAATETMLQILRDGSSCG